MALDLVTTTPKQLASYAAVVGEDVVAQIQALAAPFRGARVLHVNATAFGGGVAEILGTLVPLLNDVGLQAEWRIIQGSDAFFQVTKAMHNGLQGMPVPWNAEMQQVWRDYNQINARRFEGEYDFVIIHDPQPAGILAYLEEERGEQRGYWIWRCHIDLTETRPEIWEFVDPWVERYDAAIFTLDSYVPPVLKNPHLFIIPPAIDPLAPKNAPLALEACRAIISSYNIDPDRPYLLQVSRFDPWKDPLGVVDVYRLAKEVIPQLQLVYVASMASDDPEGWLYFERTARRAGEDPDIHLLSNVHGVGNAEVNAFQSLANVIIQKSTREGFGLSVTEALWKARPTVATRVGGIPLQVLDDTTGYLVSSTEEAVERVIWLLQHQEEAKRLGEAAREHVRQNFLTTRYLRDYLQMFQTLAQTQTRQWPAASLIGQAATNGLGKRDGLARLPLQVGEWWRKRSANGRSNGAEKGTSLGQRLTVPLDVWWQKQKEKATQMPRRLGERLGNRRGQKK